MINPKVCKRHFDQWKVRKLSYPFLNPQKLIIAAFFEHFQEKLKIQPVISEDECLFCKTLRPKVEKDGVDKAD